jgi:hypothetical protein
MNLGNLIIIKWISQKKSKKSKQENLNKKQQTKFFEFSQKQRVREVNAKKAK